MTSEISAKELFRLLPWSLGKLSLSVLPVRYSFAVQLPR